MYPFFKEEGSFLNILKLEHMVLCLGFRIFTNYTISVIDMFKEDNVLSEHRTVAFIIIYAILSTVAGIIF